MAKVLKIARQGGTGYREGAVPVLDPSHPVPRVFERVASAVLIGTVAMAPQFGVQVTSVHVFLGGTSCVWLVGLVVRGRCGAGWAGGYVNFG